MDQILNAIIAGLVGIIGAMTSLIIAYLNKKKKLQEEIEARKREVKDKEIEIKALHNGFREYVYKEIKELKVDVKDLKVDTKLVKKLVVENKTHYKELEDRSKR